MTYMVDFTVVVTWTHITDPTITISDEITLSMVTLCSVTAGTSAFPDYTVDVQARTSHLESVPSFTYTNCDQSYFENTVEFEVWNEATAIYELVTEDWVESWCGLTYDAATGAISVDTVGFSDFPLEKIKITYTATYKYDSSIAMSDQLTIQLVDNCSVILATGFPTVDEICVRGPTIQSLSLPTFEISDIADCEESLFNTQITYYEFDGADTKEITEADVLSKAGASIVEPNLQLDLSVVRESGILPYTLTAKYEKTHKINTSVTASDEIQILFCTIWFQADTFYDESEVVQVRSPS